MYLNQDDELEAVNEILGSIGEPPVSTIENTDNLDVVNALRVLRNSSKMIQSKGWTFNIEQGLELVPDYYTKNIPYSSDILSMRLRNGATPYVNRNGLVYDRLNRTDVFDNSISVDTIRMRPLSDMPECFYRYIVNTASLKFASNFFGEPTTIQRLQNEVEQARIDCNEYELDYGNYNALTGDSYISQQLSRG